MMRTLASSTYDLPTYRMVIETHSKPLPSLIEWVATEEGNIEVQRPSTTIPHELRFLEIRDRFHRRVTDAVGMPERAIDLLLQFLRQNEGRLSQDARDKEFASLTQEKIAAFESIYSELTRPVSS